MTQRIERTPDEARLLTLGQAAILLFGSSTMATRARVARMVDRGDLSAVRVGRRGDRLISRAALDALLAHADGTA